MSFSSLESCGQPIQFEVFKFPADEAGPASSAFAVEIAAPGDTGVIRFPLQSSSASDADLEAATLDVAAPPQFVVQSASLRGPHTIPPAQSYTFVVEYEIAAAAPDGSFTVTLTPRSPTESNEGIEVSPALSILQEVVAFKVVCGDLSLLIQDSPKSPYGPSYNSRLLGPFQGPGNGPIWLHGNLDPAKTGITFTFTDTEPDMKQFKLSQNNGAGALWEHDNFEGLFEWPYSWNGQLNGLGYWAELTPACKSKKVGLAFDIDSERPTINSDLKLVVDQNSDPLNPLTVKAEGTASDNLSGISEVALYKTLPDTFPTGSKGETTERFSVPIPAPRGPSEGQRWLVASDMSGLADARTPIDVYWRSWDTGPMDINSIANKGPLTLEGTGNLGNLLKWAYLEVSCVKLPEWDASCNPPPCNLDTGPGHCPWQQPSACNAPCATVQVNVYSGPKKNPIAGEVPVVSNVNTSALVIQGETYNPWWGDSWILTSFWGAPPGGLGDGQFWEIPLGPEVKFSVGVTPNPDSAWVVGGVGDLTFNFESLDGSAWIEPPAGPLDPNMEIKLNDRLSVQVPNVIPGPNNWLKTMDVTIPPPSGMGYLPNNVQAAVDIITPAKYSGPVIIRMRYDPGYLTTDQQNQIRMYQFINGSWQNVASQVAVANHRIDGLIERLAPLGLFIPTSVVPQSEEEPTPAGLALSVDPSGNLWEIGQQAGSVLLGKYDTLGSPLASIALPGGKPDRGWSVRFDAAGNAFAVGDSALEDGSVRPTVYRVAASGDALISSRTFVGIAGNDYFGLGSAQDPSGAVWIAGAVRAYDLGGQARDSLALWKYSPAEDALSLTATYSAGSGLDNGLGAAIDSSGNVWVIGYSSNPATQGSAKLDLALWKFDSSGRLSAGPFRRYGYAPSPWRLGANITAQGGSLFVSAGRYNSLGNYDLRLLKYDNNGDLIFEKAWHGGSGWDDLPHAIAVDSSGTGVTVVGGSGPRGIVPKLAVWAFSSDGTLQSALSMPGASGASGIVGSGAQTWLAVADSTAPYRLNGGEGLAGALGPQKYSDVVAPVTTLSVMGQNSLGNADLWVGTATSIGFSSTDPGFSAVSASGIDRTEFTIDDGDLQAFSSNFMLSEGDHVVRFRSLDKAGNWETFKSRTIKVVLSVPMPRFEVLGPNGPDGQGNLVVQAGSFITFTGAVIASTEAPSQPGTVYYSVGGSSQGFHEPFSLGSGTHRLSYYGMDFAGRQSAHQDINIVELEAPGLNTPGPLTALNQSASSLGFSWAPNGNPTKTLYDVRIGTGPVEQSCDLDMIGTISTQTVAVSTAVFANLSAGTQYIVHVCNPALYGSTSSVACNEPILMTTGFGGLETQVAVEACGSAPEGNLAVALDPAGRMWQVEGDLDRLYISRYSADGGSREFLTRLPGPNGGDWNIGFDGSGHAHLLETFGPRVVVYEVSPEGVIVSSGNFSGLGTGGRAEAVDSDGTNTWIAGVSSGSVALWKADSSGVSLAGLSVGGSANAVLAGSSGIVWFAGAVGETALWRFDPANGSLARFDWTNSLGGSGSAAQALLEDASGDIWMSGWTRTPSTMAAALWRWNGNGIALIATSTEAFVAEADGLDLDEAGRFWISGRTQADPASASQRVLWQRYAWEDSPLHLVISRPSFVPMAPKNAGSSLVITDRQAKILTVQNNGGFGVINHAILGALSGSLSYSNGFYGGNVFFFVSETPNYSDFQAFGAQTAPDSGSIFNYTLDSLPAPATYYVMAIYDLSGALASGDQQPGINDPIGVAVTTPVYLGGTVDTVSPFSLAADRIAPTVSILAPVQGSTIPPAMFSVSGTATDSTGMIEVSIAIADLDNGTWWNELLNKFVIAPGPVWNLASWSGPMNSLSWGPNSGILPFVSSGKSYSVYAEATDVSGNSAISSAMVVMVSTVPGGPGYGRSLAVAADPAGSIWAVVETATDVRLAKFSSQWIAASEVVLPDAAADGMWSIRFGPQGEAYAVGMASGPGTVGLDLAVYAVSATADALVSSSTLNSAMETNDYAADSVGDIWITGAVEDTVGGTFVLGLWKYELQTKLLSLATTYSRGGGMDLGMGIVTQDAALWVSGFSRDPVSGKLDLALWRFDAGGTLVAGPNLRPGYLNAFEGDLNVKVAFLGGNLYVAATRDTPARGRDLAILKYDLQGQVLSERVWYTDSGGDEWANALESAGNGLVAAGGNHSAGNWRLAVWRIGLDGAILSAQTLPGIGPAQDLAVSGSDLWLAADFSAPFKLTGGVVLPGREESGRGLAMAADASGNIWEVIGRPSGVSLTKHDGQGSQRASLLLPDASEDTPWSIQFDGAGNAYAVGAASGPATVGLDLAVYKASGAGDQLLGTTIFNSPGNANDYAVDSAGDIWITGAVGDAEQGQLQLALWRYVLADGSMNLVTSYGRGGGLDLGTGIAAKDGDLWVSGYSRDPLSGKLDLALWRFNGIGTLVSGPHLRSGYLNDFADNINASLSISGDSLFVAATRHNSQGNTDLAVVKFDGTGGLQGERIWAGAAGGDDWPSGLEALADGLVAVGGSVSGQEERLAVWRIDGQGRVTSAETLPGLGEANGLALAGNDLWLALASSVPYRFTGGQTLPAMVDDSQGWGMAVAVAVDVSSNVWEVVGRQTGISLAKHDSQGRFDYSVSLPEASDNGKWSIQFDMSGNAYAVGIASGPSTRGLDLAVYKVAAAGSPVLNSTFFNNEGDVNEYAVDSAGDIWITGAIGDAEQGRLQLALWRYAMTQNGLMSLATTYSRGGGMDVGFGIAATDGHLWVSGFSRDAVSGRLDLALWKFDREGNPEGPPFLRPGYLNDFVDRTYASVARFDGSMFVAASRHNAQGDTDMAVLKFNDLGQLQNERIWQSAANGDDWAGRLKASTDGLVAAGGSVDGVANRLAVWRLDNQGHVISAQTAPDVGNAEDLAVSGTNLWLAIGSSAPYRFTSVQAIAGQETVLWTAAQVAMTPTVGPIGIPFTIAGTGFGAYNGANTRVKFGSMSAALSVWNDTTISGTVPGLSTGAYAVAVERQHPSSTTVWDAGTFNVTALQAISLTPSSGPIGVPFTIAGESFGPYNGANTRVMVGGAAAPLSLWNNSTISGTIPGSLGSGTHSVRVERQVGSTISVSNLLEFTVTLPQVAGLTPSSGPIGVPFTIAGASFGPYNGANTRVLIGGATAPLSVWNDSTISGTIPGISTGIVPVRVERAASGGLVAADTWYFEVTMPVVASISPSSGPIGVAFTLTGSSFGPYNGANTQVLVGTSTAALSLWNDTTIRGTVPGTLGPGPYPVRVVRKTSDGGSVESSSVSFQVAGLYLASISPSSGPIGAPFTITGTDFDSYGGANTRVLFNGATAALSLWNDTTILGTVPALAPGTYEVLVERQSGEGVSGSNTVVFTVNGVLAQGITPSSGPIGVPFSISGLGFGPYNGANTRVLVGGTTAYLSLWTDTLISGTIPGVSSGTKEVFVERAAGGSLSRSDTFYFEVTAPLMASMAPSSGPIGMPFTITGTNFGPYNGANTRVLVGGTTAALSLWNDTTISGSIPGVSTGMQVLVVERLTADGGRSASETVYFEVLLPEALTLSPSSGPIGVPFTVTGRNFGPYNGSLTRVLLGGTTAALSIWNDGTISGTIPGLAAGTYSLVVERRTSDGGAASSVAGTFEVLTPAIAELTPASGPMGMPFTITGTGFGPYNGATTRVLVGGTTAPLSLWNDSTIQGTAPALSSGTYSVVVERQSGQAVVQSNLAWFNVVVPEATSLTPSSGPIGIPFTITGTGFGPYNGANTRVLIGGTTAPLSVWNDTAISGTVPGSLAAGSHPVVIERATTGGLVSAGAGSFEVTTPQINSVAPSSAPVGNAFTIRGTSFGSYNGANTRVLIGGTAAPLSLWNDSTIAGRLPFLSTGFKAVVVERTAGGSVVQSNEASIEIVAPVITTITPAVALQGTPFELTGTGFGQYAGTATRVLIGGTTTALSLWNDTTIRGLVPDSLPDALYAVVVERDALGGTVTSEPVYFIVDPPGSALVLTEPAWFSEASLIVSTDTGGKVEAPSRASVEVPPAALKEETVITVSKPKDEEDEEKRERARKAQPIVKAGDPVEFGPEGTKFQQKVTIEVPFDPELVPPGKSWLDVALHYWNKDAGKWDPLETEVDMVGKRLKAKTDHFSLYQPMVMGIKPEATASGDFNFRDVYVFPNPAKKVNPTFRIQVGRADNVELTIMDVSGMVVDKGSCGSGQVRDIDNGMGNQFTFECAWDASRAGSGIYVYMVRARKAGFKDITVVKKVGIVR